MCQFDVIDSKNNRSKSCFTSWDIFNTILFLTDSETEAKHVWLQAGHLKVGGQLTKDYCTVKRVA